MFSYMYNRWPVLLSYYRSTGFLKISPYPNSTTLAGLGILSMVWASLVLFTELIKEEAVNWSMWSRSLITIVTMVVSIIAVQQWVLRRYVNGLKKQVSEIYGKQLPLRMDASSLVFDVFSAYYLIMLLPFALAIFLIDNEGLAPSSHLFARYLSDVGMLAICSIFQMGYQYFFFRIVREPPVIIHVNLNKR